MRHPNPDCRLCGLELCDWCSSMMAEPPEGVRGKRKKTVKGDGAENHNPQPEKEL